MTEKQIRAIHLDIKDNQGTRRLATCLTFEMSDGRTVTVNAKEHVTARFVYDGNYVLVYDNEMKYMQYISFESIIRIGVDYEDKAN